MNANLSRLVAAALIILALAVPAQGAYSFGTIVDKNDYDFQQAPSIRGTVPAAAKFVLPCFVDEDGDGLATSKESVYLAVRTGLTQTCDQVRTKDIRLTGVGSYAGGTDVKTTDTDKGIMLTQLGTVAVPAHAVRVFNDVETLPTVRKTDTVYLDLGSVASSTVGVGDVRLTPMGAYKAGTRVQAGDTDHGKMLDEFNGGALKSLYTANMIFEFGNGWYLNADVDAAAGGAVEEGDVRLTGTVPNPFADIAANVGNPGKVVESLSFSADVVPAGTPFQAYILVKNPTVKVGSALVETRLDGVLVDARGTPTLAKDEAATLVLTLTAPLTPGQHKVQAGETTAFFEVEGSEPTVAPATQATSQAVAPVAKLQTQGTPAVAAIAPMAALAFALLVLRRLA